MGAQSDQALIDVVRSARVIECNRALLLGARDALILRDEAPEERMRAALAQSDRIASVQAGRSVLLKRWVLNVAGFLDETQPSLNAALDEWRSRARKLGLRHVTLP